MMVLRLLFTDLFHSGLWSYDFLSDKTANCRAGLAYNKTTRQNSEQCHERVEQNSYKVVQMLLLVAVIRSISRTCRADIVRISHRRRTYVAKTRRQTRTRWREFLHREKRREMATYTRCMYEFMRYLYDICPTCVRDENSHENFKPFKILDTTCRVLASSGDISTTCEDICTSSTRHMTSYCEL